MGWVRSAVRRGWAYLRCYEPARARAGWVAVLALLATQGISVSAGVDAKVQLVLGVLAIVVPLVQGEVTRAGVYSPATAERIAAAAAQYAADGTVAPERAATIAIDGAAHLAPKE